MRKYLVVYEKAEKNFSAFVPDLPGCIATGETRREVEKNIHAAIKLHIEGMKEDNIAIPQSSAFAEFVEV